MWKSYSHRKQPKYNCTAKFNHFCCLYFLVYFIPDFLSHLTHHDVPLSPFSCSPVYPPACSPFFLFAKSFAIFIIVCGDYLKIHTVNGPVKTLVSFSKLRTMLPAEEFIRIHRSFIIPLRKIRSMEKRWILIGQKRVPLGDYYKKEYLKPLNQ